MRRGEIWFCIILGITLGLFARRSAAGDLNRARWAPTEESYQAENRGKDCTVYRSLAEKAKIEVVKNRGYLSSQIRALKTRRIELEDCAEQKGAKSPDETSLAELCPEAYDDWLSPSYRLQMIREDLGQAKEALENFNEQIRSQCGRLPPPPPERVSESETVSPE
jgi:hypothetical protein